MRTIVRYVILNAVLLACITAIITPSFASQEHVPLLGGIIGGFIIGLIARVPGAVAQWYLSTRRYQLAVYIAYGVAGLLTALTVLANHADHADHEANNALAGNLLGSDALASMTGIYLFLSSILLVFPAVVVLAARLAAEVLVRRYQKRYALPPAPSRSRPARPAPAPATVPPYRALPPATSPRPPLRPPPTPAPPIRPPSPAHDGRDRSRDAASLRTEISVALGIVTGLTSLVQGFDSHNILKTLTPLLIFGLGAAAMYALTTRRRP